MKKGEILRGRGARQDLIEIFRQIARDSSLKSARRFLSEAESTFQRLASLPRIGTAFMPGEPRFAGLRYCPVSRFKAFIVFYRPGRMGSKSSASSTARATSKASSPPTSTTRRTTRAPEPNYPPRRNPAKEPR